MPKGSPYHTGIIVHDDRLRSPSMSSSASRSSYYASSKMSSTGSGSSYSSRTTSPYGFDGTYRESGSNKSASGKIPHGGKNVTINHGQRGFDRNEPTPSYDATRIPSKKTQKP